MDKQKYFRCAFEELKIKIKIQKTKAVLVTIRVSSPSYALNKHIFCSPSQPREIVPLMNIVNNDAVNK
jgi:hypothetical protein